MMKYKWISIIGVSMLVIGLSACSNIEDSQQSADTNSAQNETPSDESNEETSDNSIDDKGDHDSKANSEENESHVSNKLNILEDDSITALVNKFNNLDETYVPDDLVTVSVPTVLENPEVKQLRKEAADALEKMFDVAKESGVYLHARSGYRSYETQVQLFNNYAERHGEEAANRYSARPGHSEHQTGLVMDVTSESVNFQLDEAFGETKEGKWLREHAHEFGFIIRYPKDMEEITGYIYEPWHIRYLGVDVATAVFESGLTYEEFLVEEEIIHEVNSEKKD